MEITVVHKEFDLYQYKHQIAKVLSFNMSNPDKARKLKVLVQQAYEQGISDGKGDDTWYDRD